MPILSYSRLVGKEGLLSIFTQTERVAFYMSKEVSQRADGLVRPLASRHLLNEDGLRDGELSEGQVDVWNDILRGPER